jgi:ribosomal protein S27AE
MFGLSQGATTALISFILICILASWGLIAYRKGEKDEIKAKRKKEQDDYAEKKRREEESSKRRCPYCGGMSFGFSHDDFDSYELVCNKCGRKM